MYDVTSTNGHSEDYYQVPLKKNLNLERRKYNNTTFNTREMKKIRRRRERNWKERTDSAGERSPEGGGVVISGRNLTFGFCHFEVMLGSCDKRVRLSPRRHPLEAPPPALAARIEARTTSYRTNRTVILQSRGELAQEANIVAGKPTHVKAKRFSRECDRRSRRGVRATILGIL